MKTFTIKKEVLKNLLKDYFEYTLFNENSKKQIDNMLLKLTDEAKENLIKIWDVIFYVTSENIFMNEPTFNKIVNVSNKSKLYLYFKLINLNTIEINKIKTIDIIVKEEFKKEDKKIYETNNIINKIIDAIDYTKSETSLVLDLDKIDSLYSEKPKDLAKGAKRSVLATLTNKKIEYVFRVHPETKNRIVSVKELESANKLDLKNKEFNCKCPICNLKYSITKENINKIIRVNKNEIIFTCNHLNTDKYKNLPFKVNIDKFILNECSDYYKRMFFINNFKQLTKI